MPGGRGGRCPCPWAVVARKPDPHAVAGHSVAFTPDGKTPMTSGDVGRGHGFQVRLWSVPDLTPIHEIRNAGLPAAFSPDEKSLLTGSHDGTCLVWKLD